MIIAVDGPAAAGKGTLAKRLARHFGLAHLETGLLYRAVGLGALRRGADPADPAAALAAARGLRPEDLADPELRGEAAAEAASKAAALPAVRAALIEFQRAFAKAPPGGARGAVLDGRDIGTVVCPDADVKLFLTAGVEVRAGRRARELRERGREAIDSRVLEDMRERDARDQGRAVAPLTPATDAHVIVTDDLDADGVFARALAVIGDGRAR
jgi:cytidylate kinase